MELSKKTTILFPPDLHEYLVALAAKRGQSLGELVRAACEAQYIRTSADEKLEAVAELRSLYLPVASPGRMKRQSVPKVRRFDR